MSAYIRKLEYERQAEREYGRASGIRRMTFAENSQALKRSNTLENKNLQHKLQMIRSEQTERDRMYRRQMVSLKLLQLSIKSPVSLPMNQAELRGFYSNLGFRPAAGKLTGSCLPGTVNISTIRNAQLNGSNRQGQRARPVTAPAFGGLRGLKLVTPAQVKDKQTLTDQRRPRTTAAIRRSLNYKSLFDD